MLIGTRSRQIREAFSPILPTVYERNQIHVRKKNLPALNLAPLYSHFDLLSRPPTAGLNTQGLCNPGRITVEGKNLAPLYSHVDFPSPPPGPPALILLRGWETITTLFFFFFLGGPCATTHGNIKAGGEGAVLGKSTCE